MEIRMNYSKLETVVSAVVLLLLVIASSGCQRGLYSKSSGDEIMKPSVTYLHLLRHTPFFTALTTEQLHWVIRHSKEWEVEAGAVIASCGEPNADEIWILLDGGWQLQTNGTFYPARHADPGKWFTPSVANGDCRLVANQHSYVMRIERAAMDEMLAKGFAFTSHMESGRRYYEALLRTRDRSSWRSAVASAPRP